MQSTEADRIAADRYLDQPKDGLSRGLHNAFLAGILHERERAAKVAENYRCADKYREQFGWPIAQREIAASIRAGAAPEDQPT